jgi:hypothetical protein
MNLMTDTPVCPTCGLDVRLINGLEIKIGAGAEEWAANCQDAEAVKANVPRRCANVRAVLAALAGRQS